jgi:hypothetical protein
MMQNMIGRLALMPTAWRAFAFTMFCVLLAGCASSRITRHVDIIHDVRIRIGDEMDLEREEKILGQPTALIVEGRCFEVWQNYTDTIVSMVGGKLIGIKVNGTEYQELVIRNGQPIVAESMPTTQQSGNMHWGKTRPSG